MRWDRSRGPVSCSLHFLLWAVLAAIMSGRHRHDWRLSSSHPGIGAVFDCSCGAIVQVYRHPTGVRTKVLDPGSGRFTASDARVLVDAYLTIIDPP